MPCHLVLYKLSSRSTYTYTDLAVAHALVLVDMVRGQWSRRYLVADASPELDPYIDAEYRTSWYTRGLPEEEM